MQLVIRPFLATLLLLAACNVPAARKEQSVWGDAPSGRNSTPVASERAAAVSQGSPTPASARRSINLDVRETTQREVQAAPSKWPSTRPLATAAQTRTMSLTAPEDGVTPQATNAVRVDKHEPAGTIVPDTFPTSQSKEYELPAPALYAPGSAKTEFGVQINGCDKGGETSVKLAKAYSFTWVKQQVRWGDMENARGQMDWRCIDDVMGAAKQNQMKVLLSVTSAPAHLRMMRNTRGWPDKWEQFGLFLVKLLTRYPGQVDAIEIWNEPNLDAEVDGYKTGASFAHFLGGAWGIVKQWSPSTMVISGGLAPTPAGTGWDHVEDREYVRDMLKWDAANRMDCFGAHANGPDGVGELNLVVDRYVSELESARPICVTEFGYALPVNDRTPKGFEWAMSHTEAQQAKVLVDGIRHARTSGNVRLVIVWNLNYDGPFTNVNAPYALMRPGWTSRALKAIQAEISK